MPERKEWYENARTNPNGIACIFIELAPGLFLELFEKQLNQLEHEEASLIAGYSHFALMVDDIFEARKELAEKGIPIDIAPNLGQSGTWQMWIYDPDGNRFEIMQYTPDFLQLKAGEELEEYR